MTSLYWHPGPSLFDMEAHSLIIFNAGKNNLPLMAELSFQIRIGREVNTLYFQEKEMPRLFDPMRIKCLIHCIILQTKDIF